MVRHRNLIVNDWSGMAIDNVINRGTVKDWADMIAVAAVEPQVRADIAALCKAVYDRNDDEADWRLYGFWQQWTAGDESGLALVDWDHPEPDKVSPFPRTVTIGPVEDPETMRKRRRNTKFSALDRIDSTPR